MYLQILKSNDCHLPAGSPDGTGGQFCSSGDSLYGDTGIYGGSNAITPRSKGGMWIAEKYLDVDTSTEYGQKIQLRLYQIESEAKIWGFPLEKIYIISGITYFEVNGKRYRTGGLAYTTSDTPSVRGSIEVYLDTMLDTDTGARNLIAHEIMHHKFQAVINSYEEQIKELRMKFVSDYNFDDPKNQDYLKKNYPLIPAFRKAYVNKSKARFEKEDGITAYSRDWWGAYKNGEATTLQAFHETLAEYGSLMVNSWSSIPKRSVWTELFKVVDKYSKDKKVMDQYLGNWKAP
jgi:hypothetical protein